MLLIACCVLWSVNFFLLWRRHQNRKATKTLARHSKGPALTDWVALAREVMADITPEIEKGEAPKTKAEKAAVKAWVAKRAQPEHLRQLLFPLGRPQERVLPGLFWLRDAALLTRMEAGLEAGSMQVLLEQS